MTQTTSTGPPGGFLAEIKDAVTARAALLVLGVLALQLAFITSYIGAFHHPVPSEIPLAVAAPARGVADRYAEQLDTLPGTPLDAHAVKDADTALAQVRDREVEGALIVDPTGKTDELLVASGAGASSPRPSRRSSAAPRRPPGAVCGSATWPRPPGATPAV